MPDASGVTGELWITRAGPVVAVAVTKGPAYVGSVVPPPATRTRSEMKVAAFSVSAPGSEELDAPEATITLDASGEWSDLPTARP